MRTFAVWIGLALVATSALSGCSGKTESPSAQVSCADLVKSATLTHPDHTKITFVTSKGEFKAELFDEKAPTTVANFKKYAEEKFYDGVLFHRIIKNFMVQTGGMATNGQFKTATHDPIKNEAASSGCRNTEYTLSMARTNAPDSATNQFFVNTADNPTLDPSSQSAGYAVFGVVVEGRNVVDTIENTPTGTHTQGAHCQQDSSPSCPKEDIVLQTVRVV